MTQQIDTYPDWLVMSESSNAGGTNVFSSADKSQCSIFLICAGGHRL